MEAPILVPDNLDEITLEQYQRFEKLNTKENQNSVFLMQKMLEIFCGVKFELTLAIAHKDVVRIAEHLYKILNTKQQLKEIFNLGSTEFGFIPDLDSITLGEYIDLDTYLGDWSKMHLALSVLYRPITKRKDNRYLIEKYDGTKYSEVMQKAPLSVAIGSMVFFYNLRNELLSSTLSYLKKELGTNLTQEQLTTLERSGDGIRASLDSLTEILQDLNISQN